jgi:cytochrome c553
MNPLTRRAALVVFGPILSACYGVGQGAWTPDASASSDSSIGPIPDNAGVPTDLPCNIQQILQANCTGCHSDPPVSGPMGLVTYADLTAPAVTDPTKTVAQMSLIRIQSTTAPMPKPPAAPLSSADISAFTAWVNAGTPMGSCAPAEGGTNPYDTPLTCTSKSYWNAGPDNTSPVMAPGGACINCHARQGGEGPRFTIAGTVYPTAHEPMDCNGASGITVVITDNAGQVLSLTTNGAGNFFSSARLALPFTAKVVGNGRERVMSYPQTNGDCNLCHAEPPVNGAPGRIMAP